MLGGGMRQVGVLAAAGIIALQIMPQRLIEDHDRAQQLASGLRAIPSLELTFGMPATNMIFLTLNGKSASKAPEVAKQLKERGIRVGAVGERQFRLVTHYWIDDAAVKRTIQSFKSILN